MLQSNNDFVKKEIRKLKVKRAAKAGVIGALFSGALFWGVFVLPQLAISRQMGTGGKLKDSTYNWPTESTATNFAIWSSVAALFGAMIAIVWALRTADNDDLSDQVYTKIAKASRAPSAPFLAAHARYGSAGETITPAAQQKRLGKTTSVSSGSASGDSEEDAAAKSPLRAAGLTAATADYTATTGDSRAGSPTFTMAHDPE